MTTAVDDYQPKPGETGYVRTHKMTKTKETKLKRNQGVPSTQEVPLENCS